MRQPAPDFTAAFLATLGLMLFMALLVLAALWGWAAVAMASVGFDRLARPIALRLRR